MNQLSTPSPASMSGSELNRSAKILTQGYIIELAECGPWLKNDLTWTLIWADRGVWHEITDAELALTGAIGRWR